MRTVNKMDIKEFKEKGYLQEINRQFLHPLGLALEIITINNGVTVLSGIIDARDDPEGVVYDFQNRKSNSISLKKKEFIEKEMKKRCEIRKKNLGFDIEPIGKEK